MPYQPLNVEANVTSKDITVRWNYNTQNNEKSITNYKLWYKENGGTPATMPMTWSDIVNKTGPPILLSYVFQGVLKPYTNYSIAVRVKNQYGYNDSAIINVEMDSAGIHCMKSVRIQRFSCPHFPAFGFFRIWAEYGEILRICPFFNPNAGKCRPRKLRIRTLFTQ